MHTAVPCWRGTNDHHSRYVLQKFLAIWLTLVSSLMATTMVASGVSRLLSVPLYGAQAQIQLQRLPKADQA